METSQYRLDGAESRIRNGPAQSELEYDLHIPGDSGKEGRNNQLSSAAPAAGTRYSSIPAADALPRLTVRSDWLNESRAKQHPMF